MIGEKKFFLCMCACRDVQCPCTCVWVEVFVVITCMSCVRFTILYTLSQIGDNTEIMYFVARTEEEMLQWISACRHGELLQLKMAAFMLCVGCLCVCVCLQSVFVWWCACLCCIFFCERNYKVGV